MSAMNISYETLYEILRSEKNRDDIQEINLTFYEDVVAYLLKNQKMLEEAKHEEEKEDLVRQIKNIKSMIREIYERREKKIMFLALNKSRTGTEGMENSGLLAEEKEYYDKLVELFDSFRSRILTSMVNAKVPSEAKGTSFVHHTAPTYSPEHLITSPISHTPAINIPSESAQTPVRVHDEGATEHRLENSKKTIKFREHVPKFLGKELEVYGPYEPQDTANLPSELANILIRKGKAEEIA